MVGEAGRSMVRRAFWYPGRSPTQPGVKPFWNSASPGKQGCSTVPARDIGPVAPQPP